MPRPEDVRCPRCNRLLARRRPGLLPFEVAKRGSVLAVFAEGELGCVDCGSVVSVRLVNDAPQVALRGRAS